MVLDEFVPPLVVVTGTDVSVDYVAMEASLSEVLEGLLWLKLPVIYLSRLLCLDIIAGYVYDCVDFICLPVSLSYTFSCLLSSTESVKVFNFFGPVYFDIG